MKSKTGQLEIIHIHAESKQTNEVVVMMMIIITIIIIIIIIIILVISLTQIEVII
jgi:hypothetical protein